jgi:DNA (cytosine-5)-methyltransferase 1
MGVDWMTLNELSQAIPPAYTEWIGARLMEYLNNQDSRGGAA